MRQLPIFFSQTSSCNVHACAASAVQFGATVCYIGLLILASWKFLDNGLACKHSKRMYYFAVSNLTGARMEVPLKLLCEDGIIDGKHLTMCVYYCQLVRRGFAHMLVSFLSWGFKFIVLCHRKKRWNRQKQELLKYCKVVNMYI